MPVDDVVRHALDVAIERLLAGQSFHVVEFSGEGVVIWEITRDRNGTPHAESWPPFFVDPNDDELPDDLLIRGLADRGPLVFVHSSPGPSPERVRKLLREFDPDPCILDCAAGFEDVLRAAIKNSGLTHFYELVLLRKTRSGKLFFHPVKLFAPGYRSGARKRIRVSIPRSDARGTVFVLVTTEGERSFDLMSIESVDLTPGEYDLTAELVRPGRVRFDGLPSSARLRHDHRSWSELRRDVPRKLAVPVPTHLICLVEVTGTKGQIGKRLDWIRDLITWADRSDGELKVSLVTYGAHSFERGVRDEPATERAWAAPGAGILPRLDELERYEPVDDDYRDAAQLECALALVRSKVSSDDGRPVILTMGSRRPFPPRNDPRLETLPCPRRVDWRQQLAEIARAHHDLTLGAICDRDVPDMAIWREIGTTAIVTSDVVERYEFAARLGIGGAATYVPFPLVVEDGD